MMMARYMPVLLAFALAGCGPHAPAKEAAKPSHAATPKPVASKPGSPAPADPKAVAGFNGKYIATSNTAMGVTGDLVIKPGSFEFDMDQRYDVGAPRTIEAGALPYASEWMTVTKATRVTIWPVTAEHVGKDAPNGNLCGSRIRAIGAAFIESYGETSLVLAAFGDVDPIDGPPEKASPCATFFYMSEAEFEKMARESDAKLKQLRSR